MVWGGVIYFMLLKVSVDILKYFAQRVSQLYEQGADEDCIGEYVRHWSRWVRSGVRLQYMAFKVGGSRMEIPPAPPPFLLHQKMLLTSILSLKTRSQG